MFELADALILDIYMATKRFPPEERFGLQAQIRRAAVSTATNIVEGSARRSERERLNFFNIATGSASEVRYLVDLSRRLRMIDAEKAGSLEPACRELVGCLVKLTESIAQRISSGE